MPDQKRLDLLRALVTNTDKGVLRWEATSTEGQFQLALASHTLTVSETPSSLGTDETDYLFNIFDAEGRRIDTFSDTDVGSECFPVGEGRTKFYNAISEFYHKVRRSALGVDDAINSILNELKDLGSR